MTQTPRLYRIDIAQSALDDLKTRLSNTRFPDQETVGDWDQGIPLGYVEELTRYWHDEYDWRRCEAALNALPNYLVEIDGLDIHFIHVRSENPAARPLVLTHGWPGSVLEFLQVAGPLSRDFHLVIPSLPGYGFSGKPTRCGWDIERIARTWDELMKLLGYHRYFAQGGDWGAAVTCAIGEQALGGVAGIHINMIPGRPDPAMMTELTDLEKSALARFQWYQAKESGYATQQMTRPQTLGYGLADSPVGQMAWIIEKFHGWADCAVNGVSHPENVFSRDHLLDNVMLYWLTNSGASSARLYWESFSNFSLGDINVPTGCSLFPMELMRLSRRWAETRYKNIVYWNELPKGGHFAAMEQGELFVAEVRACFAKMEL